MKKRVAFVLAFFLLICARTAACDTWRLGVLVCMSGECAESGVNSQRGIDLAIEELNNAGGVLGRQVTYKLEDTDEGKSSGRGAVSAFQKLLLDPSIKYLIGPSWTPGGLSVAPIAARHPEIILTSPSLGVAEFNKAGPNIFCTWPHDEIASNFLADYAHKKGYKRVAIFSSQQPWELLQGHAFEKHFKELGGEITVIEEPLPTDTDLQAESLRILKSTPDAVFFSGYTQMGTAAKRMHAIGYKGPIITTIMDVKTSDGALEGATYAAYPAPDSKFVADFTKKFGVVPGIGADTTYDTVKLYAWAIEAEKSFDTKLVQARLLKAKFQGASGLIEFDEFGGVHKTPVLYRVEKGIRTVVTE